MKRPVIDYGYRVRIGYQVTHHFCGRYRLTWNKYFNPSRTLRDECRERGTITRKHHGVTIRLCAEHNEEYDNEQDHR